MQRDAPSGAAVVPVTTIWDFEAQLGGVTRPANVEALKGALEAAGVEFIEIGGRPGVILKKPAQ
jgi:hypothetical protein